MGIKFIGDRTKVITKDTSVNKTGPMLRRRATIIQQIINGTATITPAADYYTKMLLHFDDSALLSPASVSVANPFRGVLSPDKSKLYVGEFNAANNNNKVFVIDTSTNQLLNTFTTSASRIVDIVINSTGSKIYVTSYGAGTDNKIYEVDVTNGITLRTFTLTDGIGVFGITITPDDKFLYAACMATGASTSTLHLVNLLTSNVSTLLSGVYSNQTVAVTRDGLNLYVSGDNVRKYNINNVTGAISNEILLVNVGTITSAPHTIVSNEYVYVCGTATGQEIRKIKISDNNVTTITGTSQAYTMFLDYNKNTLYAAKTAGNSIYVVNTSTNTLVDTLTGFTAPRSVYVANNKLFVANNTANTISVKDFNEGGTIASVFAPMRGVASPDGTKVYMGAWGSGTTSNGLHVIDVATNTKTATISTPGTTLDHTVNSTGTRVYSTQYGTSSSNNNGSNVYVFDATNNTLLATVPVGTGAHSIAITPDDKFVYVTSETTQELYRINTANNVPTRLYTMGVFAVEISPDGSKLLASSGSGIYVYSINKSNGDLTLLKTVSGIGDGNYTSAKNSNYAYFLSNSNGIVTPISWSTLTAETAITVGSGPYGACVSSDGKKLFVSNNSGNSVSVIDTASNKVIDTITGYSSPRGAVFAGNKLFVCNNGASNVPVVDMRTFSDSALSPMLQNRAGTSVLTSTTQSKFGGKSLALNGTNTNKLQFANPKGKAMDLSNKPFCVEGWFYLTSGNFSGNAGLISWANTDNGDCQGIHIDLNSSNRFEVFMSTNGSNWDLGGPTITTSVSPTLNTWFHLALIRETMGGDIKLVHNGTVIGTKVTTSSLYTGDYLYVAKTNYQNITKINGYVDDVRVVVGSCPYSSSAFVVPTAELAATADTKLLIKGSTTIKDDSSLNLYTQALGSAASSTVQSKFGGSSIKIASATGDFIKVTNQSQPIALFDRPFTIEGWFWLNANNVGYQPLIMMRTAGSFDGPLVALESNNTLTGLLSNGASASWLYSINTSYVPSANAWHHVALVREYTAGPIKLYCDGVLRGSNATTAPVFTGENIFIGHYPNFGASQQTLNGYIDEVRITIDYCAYNANFTPPTAPFTDGNNCLLHFEGSNGSTTFTDSSSSPKTFTAYGTGTAISTTKSKFGSSSLYLPGGRGSGARVAATSSDFALGAGDFTIEYWFNMSAMSTGHVGAYYNSMVDTRVSSQNGHIICTNSANKLMLVADGGIYLTCNTAIQLNTWYHVAVSRKGNTVYAYLNGVLDGSATVSFNLAQNGLMLGNVFDYSGAPGLEFNGYIDEVRFTKGTALYSGEFTPPTAPFTLIG